MPRKPGRPILSLRAFRQARKIECETSARKQPTYKSERNPGANEIDPKACRKQPTSSPRGAKCGRDINFRHSGLSQKLAFALFTIGFLCVALYMTVSWVFAVFLLNWGMLSASLFRYFDLRSQRLVPRRPWVSPTAGLGGSIFRASPTWCHFAISISCFVL